MKSIFLFLFTIFICNPDTLLAQKSKKKQQVKEGLNLSTVNRDEGFEVIEIPEKWKEESAVIICQSLTFKYIRKSVKKISVEESSRKRIKLQDKAAVEEFSKFYYINVPNSSVGFKIVKPDGREMDIDPSESIEVEEDIPAIFQAYGQTLSYKKLAIPGLEIGDIIDYAYVHEEVRRPGPAEVFAPVIMNLHRKYPLVKQIVEFDIDGGFFLNFNSYKGAPELVEIPLTAEQELDDVYWDVFQYKFVDEMREKEQDEKWHFPFRTLPTVKFQVYYLEYASEMQASNWIYYLGKQGIVHNKVDKVDIQAKTSTCYHNTEVIYVDWIQKYLKKYHEDESDKRKLVEIVYYYFRHLVTIYGSTYNQEKTISDLVFARTMDVVLSDYDIEVEVNACVPRNIGILEEVLFPAELSYFAICQLDEKEYVLLTNFDKFTNMGDIPYYLEGQEGLELSPALARGNRVPTTNFKENQTHTTTAIEFNENMNEIKVARSLSFKGHNRNSEWTHLVIDSEYLEEDLERHPVVIKYPTVKAPEFAENQKEELSQRLEYIESNTSRELGVELTSYDSFELEEDGRYHDNPILKYNESFTLTDLLQKAGGNYIVEIGRFIGKQVEITDDIQERLYDIYMSYARSFVNEIELTIPKGYILEGWEALNMEVKNNTGIFRSTAKIEEDKLIIDVRKAYRNNYEPKENWSAMIDFLEAAYQFSQQKVVLKQQ